MTAENTKRLEEIRERNEFICGGSYGTLEDHKRYCELLDKQKFDVAFLLGLLDTEFISREKVVGKLKSFRTIFIVDIENLLEELQ